MSDKVTYEFTVKSQATFTKTFESGDHAWSWIEGLSDGDILSEAEAGSGFDVREFTAKRAE